MEILKAGIYLNDEAFSKAFVKALSRESENIVFTVAYNMEKIDEFDLFLTDFSSEKGNAIGLTTELNLVNKENPPYQLFKYSDSHQVIKDLFFIFFQITGKHIDFKGNRKCRLVGIAAFGGGFGATSVSLSVAKTMDSLFGQKCLYMNVSNINDSLRYLGNSKENSLTKLVYYIDEKENFPLSSFISQWDNVDYIDTEGNYQNYPLKINKLIDKAYESGKYNYFLVDMGNNLSWENLKLLEQCHCILLIDNVNVSAGEKLKDQVCQLISNYAGNTPIIKVINFYNEEVVSSYNEELEGDYLKISCDDEAFCLKDKVLHINLDRNYGNEIANISKEIMEVTYGKSEELV